MKKILHLKLSKFDSLNVQRIANIDNVLLINNFQLFFILISSSGKMHGSRGAITGT